MRRDRHNRLLAGAMVGLFTPVALAISPLPRVEPSDLYRAQQLKTYMVTTDLAMVRLGRPWTFGEEQKCNFTYFSPEAKDVAFGDDGLRFRAEGDKVVVGWGNHDGRQAKGERVMMFSGWNEIEMRVRQSVESSQWTLALWANGSAKPGRYSHEKIAFWAVPHAKATVKGKDWQTVRFRVYRAGADGFGLTVTGAAGSTVEIASIQVTQSLGQGCFRKEFVLPKGKVWRAVGEVSRSSKLILNGHPVPVVDTFQQMGPVDLARYLMPGEENVLCLFAQQSRTDRGEPMVYFQGKAIMTDGTVVSLDADASWRGIGPAKEGWTELELDTSSWQRATLATPSLAYAKRRWPVYDGRLLLENPGNDPKLYFDSAKPVQVSVRVPEGLQDDRAVVAWVLRRVEREDERLEVGRGVVQKGQLRRDERSVVYMIDLGKRDIGVYTLEAEMEIDGKVVERRFEEPLVVVGRLPMREVAGDSYEEGMDLELEDVIDFTDPADPHRWVEAKTHRQPYKEPAEAVETPRIVRKEELVYREVTDDRARALFSYRFEFRQPFSWYLMVLEYPNDAERWTGVSVTSATRDCRERPPIPFRTRYTHNYSSEDGPSLVTGGKYPLDGKMHEMRWLHWADPEIHTLDIVNLKPGLRAAAARVWIYRVKELPALSIETTGERFFGIHMERARSLGRTFSDADGLEAYQNRYDKLGYDMVARFTQRLRWYFDACRNYTAYLRFTGQNLHVMGAFQYSEHNTAYTPPERMPGDGRLLQDIRGMALRFFEPNDIAMYSMVEYTCHKSIRAKYAVGDAEVAEGADTVSFVTKDGKQGGWHANPNHPAVEAGYLNVVADLAEKFAFSPAWKGIYYFIYIDGGGMGPGPCVKHNAPFDYDYSDATIAAFEADTGIRVPGDPQDPKRFTKRYLFLTSDAMRDKWIDWRCRRPGTYLRKTLKVLHEHRRGLNVLYGYHLIGGTINYWLNESGKSYRDDFREMGMDPSVVRGEPHMWFGRYIYPTGPHSGGRPYYWAQTVSPEAIAYYDNPRNRLVTLDTCWHELPTSTPGWFNGKGGVENIKPSDWPTPRNVSRFISQAHGDNALESYTQALIGADPDILVFGMTDVNIINSREQQVREVAKVVTTLPKEKFEPVDRTTDFRHNLAIRALVKDGQTWLTVANPGYWPIRGQVVLNGTTPVVRPCDGRAVATLSEEGNTVVPVALRPYGMAAFRAQGSTKVVSWDNEPLSDGDLAHMKWIIADMGRLIPNRATALAITLKDREFVRGQLKRGSDLLAAGQYAAAWSELTHWRLWTLREILLQAGTFSARLPGRPQIDLDPKQRPELKVLSTSGPAPTVDGKLDDEAWQNAPPSYRFLSMASGRAYKGMPLVDTSVQACRDEKNLYLALRMADPDVSALRKTASAENPVQVLRKYDDTVVMFLCPRGKRVQQFATNAGGVRYFAASGEWGVSKDNLLQRPWDLATGVEDGEWTVEAAIPFASLEVSPPKPGEQWRANFLRRFREFLTPESYWARVGSWSDVEHYGTLKFE